jgi:PRC-barrel domain
MQPDAFVQGPLQRGSGATKNLLPQRRLIHFAGRVAGSVVLGRRSGFRRRGSPYLYGQPTLSTKGNDFANYPLHPNIWSSIMTTEERETVSLIGSDKVQGTAVYGSDGETIGSIERVMIEKISGKVSYAVLSFGGFLGIGDDYYPLPWPSLKYNVELGGYQTLVPVEKIKGAPKYAHSGTWDWESRERARSLDDYYGVIPT